MAVDGADRSAVIASACNALSNGDDSRAASIIRSEYPSVPTQTAGRVFTKLEAMKIFLRDGFIDRYSGQKLVFPGVLRLLSVRMPREFPFHSHWKADRCHPSFYELFPTIDHEIPITRGGADHEGNWVTTSMSRNMAKSNFTLTELGWIKHEPGSHGAWDGLTSWFLNEYADDGSTAGQPYLRQWKSAAVTALGETLS